MTLVWLAKIVVYKSNHRPVGHLNELAFCKSCDALLSGSDMLKKTENVPEIEWWMIVPGDGLTRYDELTIRLWQFFLFRSE